MLLNILQSTGHPQDKMHPAQMSITPWLRNPTQSQGLDIGILDVNPWLPTMLYKLQPLLDSHALSHKGAEVIKVFPPSHISQML